MKDKDESYITFWGDVARKMIDWIQPWKQTMSGSLEHADVRWFCEGKLNLTLNCIDRHLPRKANQAAILWEGDDEHEQRTLTFAELHEKVCRMGNVLKSLGIKKGDRVAIYLPMIPEAAIAMLGCARIGAVHTVVFAGFSAEALKQRIIASGSKLLITADGYTRGGHDVELKQKADKACEGVDIKQLVVRNKNHPVYFDHEKHFWWHELKHNVSAECDAEVMDAEDPFFILYTSGSTGSPKGLLHSCGGYLVGASYTHDKVFQCQPHEIFWCTADVGWITGHSYLLYGALSNGVTTLMHAGVPNWPDPARIWRIVDKHKVNVLYTAPTAIRALERAGDEWLTTSSRKSLRLLGTVGEPINPKVWQWYFDKVGEGRCPVVDTWWQTETGSILISPMADTKGLKPGSAMKPLPGIEAGLIDDKDKLIEGSGAGRLVITRPWPSMARTIVNDHERFKKTYIHKGLYITGDGAKRDDDGDYWITGRIDDVMNVSGHRLGSAEIESALVSHDQVAEAAVIGVDDDITGQAVIAFIELARGAEASPAVLEKELRDWVAVKIGAIAKPKHIHIAADLPKTRSGKIMRRILRKISAGEAGKLEDLGDLSTLANPQVVESLLAEFAPK